MQPATNRARTPSPCGYGSTIRRPACRFGALDADDPTRIDVVASDTISPLSRAEVEIRRQVERAGLPLPTSRSASGFVARLDDEHLEDGTYDLRARVFDSAGNERSTTVESLRPPRPSNRSRSHRHSSRRGPDQAHPRTWVKRPQAAEATRHRRATDGRLRTHDPDSRTTHDARREPRREREHRGLGADFAARSPVAACRRDRHRRQPAASSSRRCEGPSRVVRFRYTGSPLVRARTAEVEIQVKATTTIRTNRKRVVNGEDVVLSGRVLGQQLPPVGKLVQLQAYSRGRWITFATPRADAATGRWTYRYRFTSTRGTVRYRFRARVPREAGFPYASGTSRFAHVVVRGL